MAETISPDYLVIGAGAMGIAFIDTLITDTKATVAVVDRYARPGGHWTIAYPFVRLHQPSAFYGVNSRPLGEDRVDEVGLNKGMAELATGDEVVSYYNKVMQQTLLPSGRVTYYPKHEWLGDGEFRSILTNKVIRVGQNTRIVDATYMKVKVPAMSPPSYEVANDVSLITPNDLQKVSRPYGGYTVVGAGKTGIDACLWLIANGIDPKDISWIMPRDSWLLERGGFQPGSRFAEQTSARLAGTHEAIMSASSLDDLFHRLEACGELLRVDENVWPTMFKCATVSLAELEQIKRIGAIIRQGRVVRLDADKVTLQHGDYKPVPDTLYIDCTADALSKRDPVPVFSDDRITLQPVRHCQQVFSAAFIAHAEAAYGDDKVKNELCRPIPHPAESIDYPIVSFQSYQNGLRWSEEPKTAAWLKQARLDWFGSLEESASKHCTDLGKFYAERKAGAERVCVKLKEIIDTIPKEDGMKAKAQLARF
ncbi:pyridine nucleotide-disulfide oxidoreductase-domain-containing protein [Diaporthe sp. PMI_573]|nr:pyridine nucleotide-disulfide oxidoreductase-domain-containing protein [Diaporthaceae sp. PMI_573]